jgi:hypothetical protein
VSMNLVSLVVGHCPPLRFSHAALGCGDGHALFLLYSLVTIPRVWVRPSLWVPARAINEAYKGPPGWSTSVIQSNRHRSTSPSSSSTSPSVSCYGEAE